MFSIKLVKDYKPFSFQKKLSLKTKFELKNKINFSLV